ncbi:ArnT family glycosyltransferase [Methylomonas koyamae]|uniref:ArnT family glycosyltransferase n=1 Tax=Methylomonas koyamae TaxID=702114 RepID=UPI0011269E78|nr:glycosyltransferase family 39 protein [Methylomonas koyamae]TPQ27089.1 glycosyltransferase [Methylomonas koyamae]
MNLSSDPIYRWGIFLLWLLLSISVFFRAPIPIDETRYLSVAWEMWLRSDFLVPYLNGHTYSHKPPLLFWLIQLGWGLFGVNDWWPRLVGPLAALGNLLLVRCLAATLWPEQREAAALAPWVLAGTLLWTLFATSTMFDILLTDCVMLGMLGLLIVANGRVRKGWLYFGLAIGLGLLTKGPVIFLHLLPTALFVRFWHTDAKALGAAWWAGLLAAVLLGASLALAWALPAAQAGGQEYADAILWHQTADRTVGTKIHTRPFFWYLQFLPLLLFPWLFWPRLWAGLRQGLNGDNGLKFSAIWLVSVFVLFSALPSKQLHYLIPMLPAFALVTARVLSRKRLACSIAAESVLPVLFALIGIFLMILPQVPGLAKLHWVQTVEIDWGLWVLAVAVGLVVAVWRSRTLSVAPLSAAVVVAVFAGFIFFFQYVGLAYDLRPAALQIRTFNEQGVPYVYVGNYQGQLNFLGRLTTPLPVLATVADAERWAASHPAGYLVSLEKDKPEDTFYLQGHREYWLVFRRADQFGRLKPL